MPDPAALLEHINREIAYATAGARHLTIVYISDEGKELMEDSAPEFFAIAKLALQRDVFLTLARLTDAPRTGRYENISIRALTDSLSDSVDSAVRATFAARTEDITRRSAQVREWRDKYLAHNDLTQAFSDTPLDTVSIVVVRELLILLGDLAADIGKLLNPNHYTLPLGGSGAGGGKRLLRVLKQGLVDDDGFLERDPHFVSYET